MTKYWFKILIPLFVLSLLSSCVGEKKGKNPNCATGTAFDKLSQRCVSYGKAPTSTLNVLNLDEDAPATTFMLDYTDDNKDQASSCQVFDNEDDIEIRSPLVSTIGTQTEALKDELARCATSINAGNNPVTSSIALGYLANLEDASTSILSTDQTSTMLGALNSFIIQTNILANYCISLVNLPTSQFFGNAALTELEKVIEQKKWIERRCYCAGGTCRSEVVVAPDKNGSYGISYNISDSVDGTSVTKQVSINVSSVNDSPVARDFHISGIESTPETSTSTAFSIPFGRDVESDESPFLGYQIIDGPDRGTITGCALSNPGIIGSTLNCSYTAADLDGFGVGAPGRLELSTLGVNKLIFESNVFGVDGNDISIKVSQHPLKNSGSDIIVDVRGRAITIYIEDGETHINDIISAVNSDLYASSIVTASESGGLNDKMTVTPTSIALSGGTDSYDSFTYRVHDGLSYSESSGRVSIDLTAVDDAPRGVATSVNLSEDTFDYTHTFTVTDSEGDLATSCTVNTIDPSGDNTELIISTPCSCSGTDLTCTVGITTPKDQTGLFEVQWSITAGALAMTSFKSSYFTILPTNDAPFANNIVIDGPFSESATAKVLTPYSFTLPALGIDIDFGDSLQYELVSTLLAEESFTGCVDDSGKLTPGATCYYTPSNGNINGVAGPGSLASGIYTDGLETITFTAVTPGQNMNGVQVHVIEDPRANYLGVFAEVGSDDADNIDIMVYIDENGIADFEDIENAILENPYASLLITASAPSNDGAIAVEQIVTLDHADEHAAKVLEYKVVDSAGLEAYGAIHINIEERNDTPVICPYSDFADAPECGLSGCIGNISPIESDIIPKSVGVLYYDQGSSVCYKSTGISTAVDWTIMTDGSVTLEKKVVNQNGFVEINNIRIDEGGADTSEDLEYISIKDIRVSGDSSLIPRKANNIVVFYDGEKIDYIDDIPPALDDMESIPLAGFDYEAIASDAYSSDTKDVKVKIIPNDGVEGTAVVTVTFSDGTNDVDLIIPIEITNVAVQHKGWTSVVAMGPKVDKNGIVKDSNYVCNYSETKCDDGESCSGVSVPTANVSADEVNAIYFEQASVSKPDGQCYYASATGNASWIAFDSYCSMTPSYYDSACSTASCLDELAPSVEPENLNTLFTQLEYDPISGIAQTTCYRSIGRALPSGAALDATQISNSWQTYKGTGSVHLSWNTMLISGSGTISGFNIFRRLALEEFDYKRPINNDLVNAHSNEYIDNSSNSNVGPVPNTVYYYEVVPVVSTGTPAENVQIRSSDFDKIVLRVLVPGQNKALVPRDIVNITQCDKLLDSAGTGSNYEYDSTLKTFTCPYEGPGDTGSASGSTVYDFGRDLIVDRFEAGCPYTKSNEQIEACPTGLTNVATSGSCIGTVDPTVADGGGAITFTAPNNQVYYNRSSGKCFQHNGAAWEEFDALTPARLATLADRYTNAELPPVVFASQSTASSFCAETSTQAILGVCNEGGTFSIDGATGRCSDSTGGAYENYNNISGRLPSRKEQVAYSDWDLTQISDSVASTREGGLSLNSNSKCNTSSANGLETFYTDSVTPISNTLFTLPGTLSSPIRSVMTGSAKTELCSSKYGVQDSIGNVTEWSSDRFLCDNYSCEAVVFGEGGYIGAAQEIDTDADTIPDTVIDDDFKPADGNTVNFVKYELNGVTGPCIDTSGTFDGTSCDGHLSSWIYDQKSNLASRFFTPMGLPAVVKYISNNADKFINSFFEQIGISSGITSTKLHDDTIVVNQDRLDATLSTGNASGLAGVVTGGSYLSSNGAGTYHLEMIANDNTTYNTRVDVGFRCVFPVSGYIE